MIKIDFSIDDYNKLPKDFQDELIIFCNDILGSENYSLILDGKEYVDRDEFVDWLLDNQILFPKKRKV